MFQLTSFGQDLQSLVCGLNRENHKNSMDVALEIFSTLLECSGLVYIVVDGLDEIGERERRLLTKSLIDVMEKVESVRICFSSRPEFDLKVLLWDKATSIKVNELNEESIESYVRNWSVCWFKEQNISEDGQDLIEDRLHLLPRKANGMGNIFSNKWLADFV